MSTAEIGQTFELAQNMKRVISTRIANKEMSAAKFRTLLPMPKNTWQRRVTRGDWTAHELVRMAELLDCSPADFFADPEGILQNAKFLEGAPSEYDPAEATPPVRGHLRPVPPAP